MNAAIFIGLIFTILIFAGTGHTRWMMESIMFLLTFVIAWMSTIPLLIIIPFILYAIIFGIAEWCTGKRTLRIIFGAVLPALLTLALIAVCIYFRSAHARWLVLGMLAICVVARLVVRGGHHWIALILFLAGAYTLVPGMYSCTAADMEHAHYQTRNDASTTPTNLPTQTTNP